EILRRPLTSPLFPYTTLFRSGIVLERTFQQGADQRTHRSRPDHRGCARWARRGHTPRDRAAARSGLCRLHPIGRRAPTVAARSRSEEHTSELQSLTNLVCRLL